MKKQNVLYIHTHDSGQIFSPYGYQVPTDGLLQFSKDALVFKNAFCASPTCSPSRSALVTGKYPHHNGMLGLANRGFRLDDYGGHIANVFNRNGYTTVLCGIQHEYGRYSDHREGAAAAGYQLDISADCGGFSEREMVNWDRDNTEHVIRWLDQCDAAQPFFLSFGFFSTHREYPKPCEDSWEHAEVPEFLKDLPEVRDDFSGHVESLRLFDHNFSSVIRAVKEKGIYEDTIIIFTTDHGIAFPGAKCTLYDAGIRVALIMRVPGMIQGQEAEGLVSQVDILPTLCGLLGFRDEGGFDGIDMSAVFLEPSLRLREEIFAEVNFHTSYEPIRCVRTESYKYIRYYDRDYRKVNLSNIDSSITKQAYMELGLLDGEKEEEQFFDLRSDPMERENLIGDALYKKEIEELRERLKTVQIRTKDPILKGAIGIRENWTVNTNECVDPKSKAAGDFRKS